MKALSIKQPWAWAIMHAGKDIENRDWPTKIRGTVAVHVSKGMTKDEYYLGAMMVEEISGLRPPAYPMIETRGYILGTVEIVDCLAGDDSPWFFGEYGFLLQNPRLLVEPVYYKGGLGFWSLPDNFLANREWIGNPEAAA